MERQPPRSNRSQNRPRECLRRGRPARGVAVLVVLGLIAITLALSYAMMRSQSTAVSIQANASRQENARQAAIAGLHIALRKMHEPNWQGVDSVLSGTLSGNESYQVTFQTGDPRLTADDADYPEFPYRVTVLSTGYAADPVHPALRSSHRVRAVVQLVRRSLGDVPAAWKTLQQYDAETPYTVYQWDNIRAKIQPPVRIEGPVRLTGPLHFSRDYPTNDNRPFCGRIDEVAVFAKALSERDIQTIYTMGQSGGPIPVWYSFHGPRAWWRFNEPAGAVVAQDATGRHHGVVAGATFGESGISGGAARFDGYADSIDAGTMNVLGNELTLLAWFRADAFPHSYARIITKATDYQLDDHSWMLSICPVGGQHRLRFRLRAGGAAEELIANSGNIPLGEWVFAAAVYNGSQMQLYLNGVRVGNKGKNGALDVSSSVPVWIGDNPPGSPRSRYLRDLERMRVATGEDHRPLSGPLFLPTARSSTADLSLAADESAVPVIDVPGEIVSPPPHPGAVQRYRLYPGGKAYDIPLLSASLSSVTYEPDPEVNPLGVLRTQGAVYINDNVTIRGTLLVAGGSADVHLVGRNSIIEAVDLPPLADGSEVFQLPVALVSNNFRIQDPHGSTVRGILVCWRNFEIRWGDASTQFAFEGRLLARELKTDGRWQWNLGTWWQELLKQFWSQYYGAASPTAFFPLWLEEQQGLEAAPRLTIRPADRQISYHWQDWSQPVFRPHPNDAGLVWDLIDWRDEP